MWVILIVASLLNSCRNAPEQNQNNEKPAANNIIQQEDGTIALNLDKAECYSDMTHPSSNTAEWNVVVSKSGLYNVWLSSATKDTVKLHYDNSVRLNILETRLEALPGCDKVIYNSKDVSYPYFRADSFMGSLYIQDTGIYNIQVISDKILPKDYKSDESSVNEYTKLLSVVLTPTSR